MSPKGRLHSRHTRVGVKSLGEGRGSGFFYPPLITCWWGWGHKSWPLLDPQGASSSYSAQWWTKTSLWFIYTAQHRWPQLLYVPLYCSSNCTLDPGLDRSSGSDSEMQSYTTFHVRTEPKMQGDEKSQHREHSPVAQPQSHRWFPYFKLSTHRSLAFSHHCWVHNPNSLMTVSTSQPQPEGGPLR